MTVAGDCVLWEGTVGTSGYGQVCLNGTTTTAHRWAWIQEYGPLDPKLQVDHLCFNRLCVNLDHLEPVTAQENSRRAKARVTHCPKGHPLEGNNLVPASLRVGQRVCQRCNTESRREREEMIRRAAAKEGIGWREYIRRYGASAVAARSILGGE